MHLSESLPPEVEIGAIRRLEYSNTVVQTDSGAEVRRARWGTPLRVFEVSFPPALRTNEIYMAVKDLYEDSLGGLHSFDFTDWTDNETVPVRFDSPLAITGIAGHLDHIDTLILREVRLGADS